MKMNRLILATLFVFASLSFSSCKKKETALIVTVINNDDNSKVANAKVEMSQNFDDFTNGVFSKSGSTNSNGEVTFGDIAEGTWYLWCETTINGSLYEGIGTAVVKEKETAKSELRVE